MTRHILMTKSCGAIFAGAVLAIAASYSAAQQVKTPSTVSESAPARAGTASVPTASGKASHPTSAPRTPTAANESAPAPAGARGQPAVGKTESINRLPQTPSSVSESAPARTGQATVPTARYTRTWSQADANNDGVIDRFEFDRWMTSQQAAKR
jgi:hypothetical protein